MSNEMAVRLTGDIVTDAAGGDYNAAQIELIKRTLVTLPKGDTSGVSDMELALCIASARERGLSPFAKQCYFIRWVKGGPLECYPSWEGILKQAMDTREYAGHEGPFFSDDGKTWTDVWLDDSPPIAAKAMVWRKGFKVPVVGVATWKASARCYADGNPIGKWKDDPVGMMGKCALRLAIRRAFPLEIDEVLSPEQLRAVQTLASIKGLKDRQARLAEASKVIGRGIDSFKQLSRTEASELYEEWATDVETAFATDEVVDAEIVDESAGVEQEVIAGDAQDRAVPSAPPAAPLQPAPPPPPPVERRTDGPTAEPQSRGGHPPTPAPASGASDWSASRRQFETTLREAMTTSAVRTKGCVATVLDDRPVSQATDEELDAITALLISNVLQGKRAAR